MTNSNPLLQKYKHVALAFLLCAANPALAQNKPVPVPSGNPEVPQQQYQQSPAWGQLPKMQLEAQFAGPLQDTIVQRWRVSDGTICFIYLPIAAAHTPPTATGFVQYGSNSIGTISCFAGPQRKPSAPPKSLH